MALSEIKAQLSEADKTVTELRATYEKEKTPELAEKLVSALDVTSKLNAALAKELESADPLSVDIDARIAAARKEEKTKLYDRLKKLEDEKKASDLKIAEIEAAKKKLEDEAAKSDAGEQGKEKNKPVTTEAVESLIETLSLKHEQEILASKMENEARIKAITDQLHTAEINAYKSSQIAAAGGKLIPELVTGNTKEEIDNSLIRARQVYERTFREVGTARAGVEENIRDGVPTVPNTLKSINDLSGTLTAEQVRRMSPAEWKAYRGKLGLK